MKCIDKNCTNEMIHRTGKFGGFWYCKYHGTISDKALNILLKSCENKVEISNREYFCNPSNDDLMLQVRRSTLEFGVEPSEVEEWIVDHEGAADYEEDHWMNLRPY